MKIIPRPFHDTMLYRHGEKHQMLKVIEEMNELDQALKEGDRDHIVEEFSDVIHVLPYLEIVFGIKIKPFFLPNRYPHYKNKFLRRIIAHSIENSEGYRYLFRGILQDTLKFYLKYLKDIKEQYNITQEEVDQWCEEKRRRYL